MKDEIWAIHHGLKLIHDIKWFSVIVETDSQLPVQLLNHSLALIIHNYKALTEKWKSMVMHTLKEGNKCADKLNKLGVGQQGEAIRMLVSPPKLIEDPKVDIQWTSVARES